MSASIDSRVDDELRLQSSMENERAVFDGHCQEVAERILPTHQNFHGVKRPAGAKVGQDNFDSTAQLALPAFAAALDDLLTPRSQEWHKLNLRRWSPIKGTDVQSSPDQEQLLQVMNTTMFLHRYAPGSNFANQANDVYKSLGAFGNGGLFVDDWVGRGLRYKSVPFSELWFSENFAGIIDTVHRKFELTARQCKQRFMDSCPPAILEAAEKEPLRKFEILHCVRPREDAAWGRMDYKGMAFVSYYIACESRTLLREGGFRTMRYAIARYDVAPKETYARSPAMMVLADIKMVNEQQKTLLSTGQKIANPPLLLSSEALAPSRMGAGALIRGGMSKDGTRLIEPLAVGANLPVTLEMVEQTRKVINTAFLLTLFQILVENHTMTATEAMQRAQEKGALLAPTMGRLQSDFLGVLIEAEMDILFRAGAFPMWPESMDGMETDIEYTSPLAQAQKATEGVAILQMVQDVASISQFDPSAVKVLKGAETIRRLASIRGAPSDLMRTAEEVEAMDAAELGEKQMRNILGAAGLAAGAAKDVAAAQSLAASAPSQAAPLVIPQEAL